MTFRLFDSISYDPSSGTAAELDSEFTFPVFADKGTTQETKSGSLITTDYSLTFEMGLLPRMPLTQDEVMIDGILYKVIEIQSDPVGVMLRIGVRMA